MTAERPLRPTRPVFVVAAPGAGAELLADALATAAGTTRLELAEPLAAAEVLRPENRGHDTSRLGFQDAKPKVVERIEAAWAAAGAGAGRRVVATWDDAALQVPFLAAAWPDASFVFVHRDPLESLARMRAAWESGDAVTHPSLPGWEGPPWSLPLTPQWRGLAGRGLLDVVADQWRRITEIATGDLARLPDRAWTSVSCHDLLARPDVEMARLGGFLGLTWEERPRIAAADRPVPVDADDLGPALAPVAAAAQRARETLERSSSAAPGTGSGASSPYASVNTPNFPELLGRLGSSLVATTYQSGRVVVMRARDGALNTHFRAFDKPMGIAYRPGVLSLGTRGEVWTLRDVPGLAERVGAQHDAVFVPRTMHHTGDIRIHDVAWAGDDLWAVNTRFSCLVTFDGVNSFVPRWTPPWITALAAEDRCHLNGLAVVEDRVKYVTALGTTDTAGGWRPRKADGGVIVDVETDEVVATGLSMPHSPRWYRDRLWVLESGQGTLATVDVTTGEVTTVAELPGFTRGLAFAGRYAFIGLSQVREATTFGGLPLTGRLEDRQCGVWIVDIETGGVMGFVRFEDRVQEIFDVALLPGLAFPEILEPQAEPLLTSYVVPDRGRPPGAAAGPAAGRAAR